MTGLEIVTDIEKLDEIIKTNKFVVIFFSAVWCSYCNTLYPKMLERAEEFPQIKFCKVDIEDFPELASQRGVASVPTLHFFKDQKIQVDLKRAATKVIVNTLERLIGSIEPPTGSIKLSTGLTESSTTTSLL